MVVTLPIVAGFLALMFFVVYRTKLKRFVVSFEFWKIKFSVEVDAEAQPEDVQDGRVRALPGGKGHDTVSRRGAPP
jgi:hypothetical protein